VVKVPKKLEGCFDGFLIFVGLQPQFGMWLSPVRVLVWGARGRGFKSRHPDKYPRYAGIFLLRDAILNYEESM
jgi:hypothetical protein